MLFRSLKDGGYSKIIGTFLKNKLFKCFSYYVFMSSKHFIFFDIQNKKMQIFTQTFSQK